MIYAIFMKKLAFLLLFGYLPKQKELENFCELLQENYELPDDFLEMNLLRMPGKNLMNKLQHAILTLYNYDEDPDNTDVYETLLKGIQIMQNCRQSLVMLTNQKCTIMNIKV